MPQVSYADREVKENEAHTNPIELLGKGQKTRKLQGHWLLARVGKRVLRPGGIALTRNMLSALKIGSSDRVVELAPGLGVTAQIVVAKHPSSYTGVEREPAAVDHLRRKFAGTMASIKEGRAEQPGLPDASATVVYGEALLTMQTQTVKDQIISEACRMLSSGGRYAMHEICLVPDSITESERREIQAALAAEIHVGVQLLSRQEWIGLLEQHGLKITWSGQTPMHLLELDRLVQDEGLMRVIGIISRMAVHPQMGGRVLGMRRLFRRYGSHLGAVSLVAERA